MNNETISDQIQNVKTVNDTQHQNLETLIKNNYTNLNNNIKELKDKFERLQLSDKDQEVEIAKLKAYTEGLKKEIDAFRETEKTYGRQMAGEINKLKSLPYQFAGIVLTAILIIVTAGGIMINSILDRVENKIINKTGTTAIHDQDRIKH